MTKISGIGTTETDMANVDYVEGERGDGTSVKIPPGIIGLINIQRFTTTGAGTYTRTAGTNRIFVRLVGGGAGGGGVPQPTGSNGAAARGGGAGAYLEKWLTSGFSSPISLNVGAKGNGGAAGNNAGADGTDTTFGPVSGTTYTAGKGSGGASEAGGIVPRLASAAAGGTATNGDLNIPGGQSQRGVIVSTSIGFGSTGGTGPFAPGVAASVVSAVNTSAVGNAAVGKGGGGGGAIAVGTGAAAAGGNGSDGYIEIWEFSH